MREPRSSPETRPAHSRWKLFRRRECVVPTWKGWIILVGLAATLILLLLRCVFPFLAVNAPEPARVLVVEGWGSDDVMAQALEEFRRNHYETLVSSGGLIEKGSPLTQFKTWAEFGAETLRRLGADTNSLHAVVPPVAKKDRTYVSAVAVREWLRARGSMPPAINVMSVGAHSRRTRLMYEAAFGKELRIGIIAAEEKGFDPKHWWASSQGFRVVVDEVIAYLYVKLLFRPEHG